MPDQTRREIHPCRKMTDASLRQSCLAQALNEADAILRLPERRRHPVKIAKPSTRDRPRASRPSPPALRPSDPKEHWPSPPPAVPWPSSVAHGGPWSPRISPRRNDQQKHARRPYRLKQNRSADQAWLAGCSRIQSLNGSNSSPPAITTANGRNVCCTLIDPACSASTSGSLR